MPENEKDNLLTEEETVEETAETPEETPAEETPEEKHCRHDRKKKFEEKIAALEAEKEQLEAEKAELSDRLLRKVAEFDNYRRRTDREKIESVSLGTSRTLENLLPVLDSLELAASTQCSDETYKKGVDLTLNLFNAALEKMGVKKMEAVGQHFDPNFHNAVMTEPAAEGQESGTVTKVFQNGYTLNEKVLRPAMVVVTE